MRSVHTPQAKHSELDLYNYHEARKRTVYILNMCRLLMMAQMKKS